MKKEVYTVNQYGHINIELCRLMDERSISRNALAKAINARFEVIDKWYNNEVERIDTDVLARICYVLECAPGDILKYKE